MSTAILTNLRPSVQPGTQYLTSSDAATLCGVSFMSINRAFDAGQLDGHRLPSGHRRISRAALAEWAGLPVDDVDTTEQAENGEGLTVGYFRVSTDRQEKQGNLNRQKDRLETFIENRFPGEPRMMLGECASGLNCDRKQLNRIIDMAMQGKVKRLVIEFPERLSRGSYGLLSRILEKCGVEIIVTREGEQENQGKTLTDELIFDCMAMMACVNAKIYGQRASLKVRWVAPQGLSERVATLYGQGLSRRAILAALRKEGWKCANSGRLISEWGYRKVMRDIKASLPARPQTEKTAPQVGPVPEYVRAFIKERCQTGAGKKVRTRELWAAFSAAWPQEASNLSKRKFTDLLKAVVRHAWMERQSGAHFVHGLALRAA
jgi:predicted site-specific integrase-resolvase